jgi:predicted Zn-dependent protease
MSDAPPDLARATIRVDALLKAGRPAEAAAAARTALAASPDNAALMNLLAVALCESGDFNESVEVAKRAIARRPDDPSAMRTLGWSTYKTGNAEEASAILAGALALRPDDRLALVMRADVLIRQASARLSSRSRRAELAAEAERLGIDAVRLWPDDAAGYVIQGKVAVLRNDPSGASAWARRGLAREPDNPIGHQVLGMAAQLSGDTTAAADHYVSAGRLNPGGGSLKLLRSLRAAPVVGVIATIILTRVVLQAGAAIGGVVLALVLVAALWAALLYYPRWKARRTMSAQARTVLERDRRLGRR